MYNLSHFSTSLRPHYLAVFSKHFFCFLLETPGCLQTCVFGVTNYVMPKRASVQLLHGQMILDLLTWRSSITRVQCRLDCCDLYWIFEFSKHILYSFQPNNLMEIMQHPDCREDFSQLPVVLIRGQRQSYFNQDSTHWSCQERRRWKYMVLNSHI